MVHAKLLIKKHLKDVNVSDLNVRFKTVDAAKVYADWLEDPEAVVINDVRMVKQITLTDDIAYRKHNRLPDSLKLALLEIYSKELPLSGFGLLSGEVVHGSIGTVIKCQRYKNSYIVEDLGGIIHLVPEDVVNVSLRKLFDMAYRLREI